MIQKIGLYATMMLTVIGMIPGYAFRGTPRHPVRKELGMSDQPADSIPLSATGAHYLQALCAFEPWAESIWKEDAAIRDAGYFGDGGTTGNGGIRGTCGVALAYAVLARALPNDPKRRHRIQRVEEALRYAVRTHQGSPDTAVNGKKWGVLPSFPTNDPRGWQSSLWASSMGFSAALVENELDPGLVKGCKRVVAEEADWLCRKPPASGYRFDTKAEENAWQSNIVTLAAAWMPDDPRAAKWLRTAKSYLANVYTVPADTAGPLKQWIKTQTLFPSFALENHGFYYPIYQMVPGMSLGDSYLIAATLNPGMSREIRPFAEHNVLKVWQFLKGILLDSGDVAFPSGLDWSLHCFEHISYLAWLSAHFREPEAQWAEPRLAQQILDRQAVNGDGRFVGESCPDGFYREAVEARRVAIAFLQNRLGGAAQPPGSKPSDFTVNYRDVGLMMQRSDRALTTVSYGPKTMALVYPLGGRTPGQRFMISPNTSTLIGPEGHTTLLGFKKDRRGFRTELELNSRQGRKSDIHIRSTPEAVAFLEIPSDSSKLAKGQWLLTAVENDPLTGGERTLFWPGDSMSIRERSGAKTTPLNVRWVNVDQWMGFVVLGGGTFVYQGASGYNRNGAAEDSLNFKPSVRNAPRAVIVLPGINAAETARISGSVTWKITRSACRLSFRTPGGKRVKMRVPVHRRPESPR